MNIRLVFGGLSVPEHNILAQDIHNLIKYPEFIKVIFQKPKDTSKSY